MRSWPRKTHTPPGSWDYIWYYTKAHTFSTKHMNREWIENMVKIAQLPKSAELQEKFKKVGDFYRADIERAKAETVGWLREGRLKMFQGIRVAATSSLALPWNIPRR